MTVRQNITLFLFGITMTGCIIQSPKPEQCAVIDTQIIDVKKGTSFDIILEGIHGDHFYINRGLEQGLSIDHIKQSVLNKNVRLHLPKFWIGTSEHIAQIEVKTDTLFTEFN